MFVFVNVLYIFLTTFSLILIFYQETKRFCYNHCKIEVHGIHSIATKCSGRFCDRQNSTKLVSTNKACGCYSMNSRIANAVMVHDIVVNDMNGNQIFEAVDFSSINFMNLYIKNALSRNIPANYFDDYEKIIDLDNALQSIVTFINNNNGFVVIGWYKRGEIEDLASEEKEATDGNKVSIHPVSIYPYLQTITTSPYIQEHIFDFTAQE